MDKAPSKRYRRLASLQEKRSPVEAEHHVHLVRKPQVTNPLVQYSDCE
jgi:hypothetical protein